MKSEIKVEINNSELILNFFDKCYKDGRIQNESNSILIKKSDDKDLFDLLKDSDGIIARLTNKDVIDGFCRFLVEKNSKGVKLYSMSINCISDQDRFIFF